MDDKYSEQLRNLSQLPGNKQNYTSSSENASEPQIPHAPKGWPQSDTKFYVSMAVMQ